jgi:3-hydroxyisobutyrate dehydrogenase-like beta-hydroxyacid dehydrogenase
MSPSLEASSEAGCPLTRLFSLLPGGKEETLAWLATGGIHLSLYTSSSAVVVHGPELDIPRGDTFLAGTTLERPEVAKAGTLSLFLSGTTAARTCVLTLRCLRGKQVNERGKSGAAAAVAPRGVQYLLLAALEARGEASVFAGRYGMNLRLFRNTPGSLPLFGSTGGADCARYGRLTGQQDADDTKFLERVECKEATCVIQVTEQVGMHFPVRALHAGFSLCLCMAQTGK